MANFPVTMDTARVALSYLDSSDRVLWVKMGQALKSEFGDDGFDLFDNWSGQASNYDAKAVKATWRGFKAAGRITIGSLIFEAKARGFDPKAEASNAAAPELTAESRAARDKQRRIDDAKAAAEKAQQYEAVALAASTRWSNASVDGSSVYLGIKGVAAHGVRFESNHNDMSVLVPLRDNQNRLWSIQSIDPKGAKMFMKGGRMSGLYHTIGEIEPVTYDGWLLVAEGYATAATLHEAVGGAVVVAFNAGNLKPVCEALRERYAHAKILICADNDRETEERTGKNAGIEAAQNAAALVNGCVVFPQGLPIDKSDFNDLANHPNHGGGVEQVREQVKAAMALVAFDGENRAKIDNEAKAAPTKSNARASDGRFKASIGFVQNERGIWWHGMDNNGNEKKPFWVCSPLSVTANTRDKSGYNKGLLVELDDALGQHFTWVMGAEMFAGDGNEIRRELLRMGLKIGNGSQAKNKLVEFLQASVPLEWTRWTNRGGWYGDAFVFPDKTIGTYQGERVIYQSADAVMLSPFQQKGTLDDWQANIAALSVGNSRLIFAISLAFAGVLLDAAKMQSGGFHFKGDSSVGKSTALYAAVSVFGHRESDGFFHNWSATPTALEAAAARHTGSLLVLDEIGQADYKTLGDTVYTFANEQGKMRGTAAGGGRTVATWRMLYLSSGEKSLEDIMREQGQKIKAGQETRLVHIEGDAMAGFGLFDTLNDFSSSGELAKHFAEATSEYYGVAGELFIEHVVKNIRHLRDTLRSDIERLCKEWTPPNAHGQVHRVIERFAIVAIAGEMASKAGITGWPVGEVLSGVKKCLDGWIEERKGGAGNSELHKMREQALGFIAIHASSRFTWWHRTLEAHAPSTSNRAGFKRIFDGDSPLSTAKTAFIESPDPDLRPDMSNCAEVYYVSRHVFESEICKDFNHKAMARLLLAEGIIKGDADGNPTQSVKLPNSVKKERCYVFVHNLA